MAVTDHEPAVYNTRLPDVPSGAVYVARPSLWGNPFHIQDFGRDDSLKMYRLWMMAPEQEYLRAAMRRQLRGRDLVCWCAPKPCHADFILRIANTDSDDEIDGGEEA
jgi:hypothetical protein